MRTLGLAAVALMCGTSVFAQSTTSDQQTSLQASGSSAATTDHMPSTDGNMGSVTAATSGAGTMSAATTAPADAGAPATMTADQAAAGADNVTASTYPAAPVGGREVAQGPTTKVIAVGDHYTVHRVMPDGTVMVKTLTGEEAKMAMSGQTPAALAEIMAVTPQQTASTAYGTSYTSGAGTPSADMAASTAEAATAASGAVTTFDADRDGMLTPMEFAQHVIATSAPAAGGDASLSAEARRELRSRASGNGATKLLNQTADELAVADRNHDFRIDQTELAMWHSMGMPNMAMSSSTNLGAGASSTMSSGMAMPSATTASMTTGAGGASSTTGADATASTDATITTGTSVPTTSATMNSTSPTGVGVTTSVTTPATDVGTTPTND